MKNENLYIYFSPSALIRRWTHGCMSYVARSQERAGSRGWWDWEVSLPQPWCPLPLLCLDLHLQLALLLRREERERRQREQGVRKRGMSWRRVQRFLDKGKCFFLHQLWRMSIFWGSFLHCNLWIGYLWWFYGSIWDLMLDICGCNRC